LILIKNQTKDEVSASLVFAYKNFFDDTKEDDTLGIAYTRSICQKKAKAIIKLKEMVSKYKKEDETHLLPIYENVHTILHEVVHIFGSRHDHNRDKKECKYKYVMDYNTSPKDKNYFNLSPCSKEEVYNAISEGGGCFTEETDNVNRPPLSVQMEISSDVNLIWIAVVIVGIIISPIVMICICRSKDNKEDSAV
jgi:hypothetical protein